MNSPVGPRYTVKNPSDLAVAIGAVLLEGHDTTLESAIAEAAMGRLAAPLSDQLDIKFDQPLACNGLTGTFGLCGALQAAGPLPTTPCDLGFAPEIAVFAFAAFATVVAGEVTGLVITEFDMLE